MKDSIEKLPQRKRGELGRIVGIIREAVPQAEMIILFGSYARGEANENSDVDLLVVVRGDREPQGRGNPVRRAIAKQFVLPVDIVIRTAETVQRFRDDPYSVVYHALKDGVVLYDKHAA